MPKTDAEMIAEFLAKRGATVVPEGVAALSNERGDWSRRVRGEKTENELIEERHVVGDHVRNGLGEWIA